MFGIIIGTLCLFGLYATLRARRYGGYGHGFARCGRSDFAAWGHHDSDVEEDWEPRRRRRRWRWHGRRGGLLRSLFARLDTTPEQERAIAELLAQARGVVRDKREELRGARRDLAAVFASDLLEREVLEESLSGTRRVLDALQQDFVTLAVGLHDILDPRQRRIVGELLADERLGRGSRRWREYE